MKITFKSVFAIVKNLFNGAVKFIFNDATFSSELITRQWVVYRELKAGLVKAGEWKVAEWKETLRKALATAKILLKSEKMGMVQFKKVNEGNVIYTRNILMGYLDFDAIGNGLYRFIDELVLESNGGDIKGAIRSFRLENIHFC